MNPVADELVAVPDPLPFPAKRATAMVRASKRPPPGCVIKASAIEKVPIGEAGEFGAPVPGKGKAPGKEPLLTNCGCAGFDPGATATGASLTPAPPSVGVPTPLRIAPVDEVSVEAKNVTAGPFVIVKFLI